MHYSGLAPAKNRTMPGTDSTLESQLTLLLVFSRTCSLSGYWVSLIVFSTLLTSEATPYQWSYVSTMLFGVEGSSSYFNFFLSSSHLSYSGMLGSLLYAFWPLNQQIQKVIISSIQNIFASILKVPILGDAKLVWVKLYGWLKKIHSCLLVLLINYQINKLIDCLETYCVQENYKSYFVKFNCQNIKVVNYLIEDGDEFEQIQIFKHASIRKPFTLILQQIHS